jgi:hypothetical protein
VDSAPQVAKNSRYRVIRILGVAYMAAVVILMGVAYLLFGANSNVEPQFMPVLSGVFIVVGAGSIGFAAVLANSVLGGAALGSGAGYDKDAGGTPVLAAEESTAQPFPGSDDEGRAFTATIVRFAASEACGLLGFVLFVVQRVWWPTFTMLALWLIGFALSFPTRSRWDSMLARSAASHAGASRGRAA